MAITGATFGSGVTVTGGITVVGGDYAGAVIAGLNTTPFIAAWSWDSVNGFGTKYSNPGTLPTMSSLGGVAMNPDGTVLGVHGRSVSGSGAVAMLAYPWSDATGFGTKYTDASAFTGQGYGVVFTPQNDAVIVSGSTQVYAWPWNDGTGFGTRYSNSTTASGTSLGLAINPAGTAVIRGASGIQAWPWNSSTGFGTAYTSVTTSSTFNNVAFNNAGTVVFGATPSFAYPIAWTWNDSTGFGTQFSNPAVPASGTSAGANGVVTTPNDDAVIISYTYNPAGTDGPGVAAWAWNNSTGFGTKYANPSVWVASPGGDGVCISPDSKAVLIMTTDTSAPTAYAWNSSTGFGTKYASPSVGPGAVVRSITFSSYQRHTAVG